MTLAVCPLSDGDGGGAAPSIRNWKASPAVTLHSVQAESPSAGPQSPSLVVGAEGVVTGYGQ